MRRVGRGLGERTWDPKAMPQWGPGARSVHGQGIRGTKSSSRELFTFPQANLCRICACRTLFQNCCVQTEFIAILCDKVKVKVNFEIYIADRKAVTCI